MILADTFTDTLGTLLSAHTPEKGGAWTKSPASTPTLSIDSGFIKSSSTFTGFYYSAATPASADYAVHGLVVMGSVGGNVPAILARLDTTAATYYTFRYHATEQQWRLLRINAGVGTHLGDWNQTQVNGQVCYVTLDVVGSRLRCYVNGDLVIDVTDASPITAAGRPGVATTNNVMTSALLSRVWATDRLGAGDSFGAGSHTQPIDQRRGDLRARWVKHPKAGPEVIISTTAVAKGKLDAGFAYAYGSVFTAYYHVAAVPSAADYDVSCLVYKDTVTTEESGAGVYGRMSPTDPIDYYNARYNARDQQWELREAVAGVVTTLGTWAEANVAGTVSHCLLEMIGTSVVVWVDGIARITVSSSSVTAAGRAGAHLRAGHATGGGGRVRLTAFAMLGAVTDEAAPNTPTLSTATAKIAACVMDWTDVTDNGSAGLLGYRAYYRPTAGGDWTDAGRSFTSSAGTLWGLPAGASLDFAVRGEDNFGNLSALSNVIAATPTVAPAQPTPYNDLTGTHSGAVTAGAASLTSDATAKSADYAGGKTTFPDDPAFDVGATCTLRAIVSPDSIPTAGTRRAIIARDGAYSLKMNGSSLEGTVVIGTVAFTATAANVFTAETPIDVAMVYDGTNIQLYANAVATGAAQPATGSIDAATTPIVVGNLADDSEAFDGKIQHAEVLAEALGGTRLQDDAVDVGLYVAPVSVVTVRVGGEWVEAERSVRVGGEWIPSLS